MHVKTDTKEKFTVITPEEKSLSANMAEDLEGLLLPYQQKEPPHIILNLAQVEDMDNACGEKLCQLQQGFYEKNQSMVICCLKPAVEQILDENGWLELMNVTPTESEAWDIVQMEEIERELMEGFDAEENE